MAIKIDCKPCNFYLDLIDLAIEDKQKFVTFKRDNKTLMIVNELNSKHHIRLQNAVTVVHHINEKGICWRCKAELELSENTICDSCGEFNLNW